MATMMMRNAASSSAAMRPAAKASRAARAICLRALPDNLQVSETATGKSVEEDRKAYLKSLPGVTAPFDDVFDPAGLSATASIQDLRRWRESEITHGRVAMLAAVGFIIGEQLEDSPMFYNFDGRISGPAINHFQQVGQGFWEPLLIAIGLAESYRVSLAWSTPTGNRFNTLKDEYVMGELGFDPLNLKPTDPAEYKEMATKELNNGRLAMIAIAGFVLQEVAEPGVEIFEHLFYDIEKEAVLELDDIERDLGLPETPVPVLRTRGG